MKGPNAPRWLPVLLSVFLLVTPLLRRAQAQAGAQAAATYKVSDKVECHITGKWQPGTIVSVQRSGSGEMMYLVNNDGESHSWDRWAASSDIRARTGVLSDTQKAHNELAALGALQAPKAGSLDDAFQSLIRERSEMQGSKEFPVTVVFQGFLIGQAHRYSPPDVRGESSDGPGGTSATSVYPVSAQYTARHAFRDAFLTYQMDERYSCFKSAAGKWTCNAGAGGKGTVKRFREERAG